MHRAEQAEKFASDSSSLWKNATGFPLSYPETPQRADAIGLLVVWLNDRVGLFVDRNFLEDVRRYVERVCVGFDVGFTAFVVFLRAVPGTEDALEGEAQDLS